MREVELTLSDSPQDLSICAAIEGGDPAKQDKSNNAKRPQIAFFAVLVVKDFRRNIIGGPNLFFEFLLGVEFLGGSKIDEFDLVEFLACL